MATTHRSPFTHRIGRIPIRHLSPVQPENRWPSKAFVGEVVPFAATVFREGHDLIGADLVLTAPDGAVTRHAMSIGAPGTDRWHVDVQVEQPGDWRWAVEAYADDWATWVHAATLKISAGVDVELMLIAGAQLLERAIADAFKGKTPEQTAAIKEAFRSHYGMDLDTVLEQEMGGTELDEAKAMMSADPVKSAVAQPHNAADGLGTDTDKIHAVLKDIKDPKVRAQVAAEVARIHGLWNDCLSANGGPFLFGGFSIADAFFAPVVTRFRTYAIPLSAPLARYSDAVFALPAMRQWEAAAAVEPETIED